MSDPICSGRVVIVTGAGQGLGRAHALELARQGASIVVNDIGASLDGREQVGTPADDVVAEIVGAGGVAVANGDDVSDWDAAQHLVASTVERFGRLDGVVNNAGVLRDRMFANVAADEFDAVIGVHLKGHFAVGRWAATHWRERAKAGESPDGRIVNTTSGAGLQGSVGQAVYSAAKAGIAALTLVQAAELGRYGVTANAIAPSARTRMTEEVFAETMAPVADGDFDAMAPGNVSPIVAWLASSASGHVTGRVFEVEGGTIGIADGWHHGPSVDRGDRWEPADLGPVVDELLTEVPPPTPVFGTT